MAEHVSAASTVPGRLPRTIKRDLWGGADVVRTKKRNPRKTAVNKADKFASLTVRLAGRCVLSYRGGCSGKLECGHLFSRVAYSTRWADMNLYCLCSFHNIRMEDDPVIAEALLSYARELWGEGRIEDLHRIYEAARPVPTYLIQELADMWEMKYNSRMEARGE